MTSSTSAQRTSTAGKGKKRCTPIQHARAHIHTNAHAHVHAHAARKHSVFEKPPGCLRSREKTAMEKKTAHIPLLVQRCLQPNMRVHHIMISVQRERDGKRNQPTKRESTLSFYFAPRRQKGWRGKRGRKVGGRGVEGTRASGPLSHVGAGC